MNYYSGSPKVFISYSHDSREHMDRVLALANRLRVNGINCNIDQYEESPSEGWPRWMMNQLNWAEFVLVVCTEQYDRRFRGKEEPGKGRGVTWEGAIANQVLYDVHVKSTKFIPVVFSAGDREHIPITLRGFSRYELDTEEGYQALYRRLTNQPLIHKPALGQYQMLPSRERKQDFRKTSNFFAYDDAWVGRESLVKQLSDRLRASCRLLILVGITGLGKTALGERLAVELEDWFDGNWARYHQENFDNEEQASDFASVAARWLEQWGQIVTPEDHKDALRLLYRVVNHLRENRYLVQIDSLEKILQGNEEQGWSSFQDEWWLMFFKSLLTGESCQSCVLLTSQDLPGQIVEAGTRYQNFWYCKLLSGLEQQEHLALFEKTGLDVNPESAGRLYLERIGNAYEGHPLALRVIAGEIGNRPFNGNVVAYWNKYGTEIEEVEKAIEEAKTKGVSASADDKYQLDRYTSKLRRHVRSRFEKTFSRLARNAPNAYILLCTTSVYRSYVLEGFWLSHLNDWNRNEEQKRAALQALRDFGLVEEVISNGQVLLRQHHLIRSIALEHLKQLDNELNNDALYNRVISQIPVDTIRLEDVFKRTGKPTYTFVEPTEYRRLFVALRASGQGLVIEGPSGVGKTTCVKKVLEELSLKEKRIKELTARIPEDRQEIAILPKSNNYDLVIIDDFHRLDDKTKQAIADYMKVIADEEKATKLVLIGINKAGNCLIKFSRDLNNRIETIKFGVNPEKLVFELVQKGEKALNIRFDALREKIVKASYGSFHIAQLLCREACLLAGVTERTVAFQDLAITFDAVQQQFMEELLRDFNDVALKFVRGPRLYREGRAPYLQILHWLSTDDKWSLQLEQALIKHPEHRASVEQVVEKGILDQFLEQNESDFSNVLHYDSYTRTLSVEDPKFAFFIRNLSWNQLAVRAGYLSVSFTGRYDFALSFAGANRDVAKAIARRLAEAEIAVFYDEDEQSRILATDVEEYLAPIYQSEAQFVVAFLSSRYPTRIWTKFESEQFKARFSKGEVIPIWFSDSPPGMFDETNRVGGITYDVDVDMEPQVEYIAKILIRKLGETRLRRSNSS